MTQPIYNGGRYPGEREPRQGPGHGGARQPDRAGANQLHQHGQRLCRRDPGAGSADAEHQQRAGAGRSSWTRRTTGSGWARSPAPTSRRPRPRWPAPRRSGRPRKATWPPPAPPSCRSSASILRPTWWSRSRWHCRCRAEHDAAAMAAANNPNVISAQFNDSAAKDAVDVAFSQLLPQLSLQGQAFQQQNSGGRSSECQRLPGCRAAFRADLPGRVGIFRGAPGEADRATDRRGWSPMRSGRRCSRR